MKQLYELKGEGRSIRAIARDLGVSRNSVRKYLRSPQVPRAKEQTPRGSKLDPYKEYLRERLAEGLENCVVLLRELRGRGYTGGYSILKEYVHPFRRPHLPQATRRFETEPGEQAQVHWGSFTYFTSEGKKKQVWAFVMVLSWSRAIYVELVPQADVATFLRCHVNAFAHLGGVPRRCLYDNAKVVVLGREEDGRPRWNPRFLDFALRVGFDSRLSNKEIARFTNDGTDNGDNLKTFLLDLDALPSPISFPAAEEQYKDQLFDAHAHLVGSKYREHTAAQDDRVHISPETAEKFFAILDRENIVGLIGFLPVIHEFFDGDDSYNRSYQEQILSVVNRCDNKLIPFLYPYSHIGIPPNEHGHNLPNLIDQNYRGNPIPFRGIGEIHSGGILTDSYAGMRLVDPAMLELYDYAAGNDLIVMIHPELSNIEDLQLALMHNPKTIFLLHGLVNTSEAIAEELDALFREHQNVYYSVDAQLIPEYGLHNAQVKNKEQFMANLHSQPMYYRLLASALVYFKPIIDAHPTRMMWGTDLIYSWNFWPDVIHELTQFSRDFIAGLAPEAQEMFAYKNAMEMLDLSLDEGH